MKLFTHLSFDGECAEAFRFYEEVLRGKIETLMTFRDSPMASQVGPDWQDRVLHAHLAVDGGALMGGDAPPGAYSRPTGFCVNVQVDSVEEAERIFNALAEGGQITMPLQKSFWAERFGMLVDRFGVPWIINGPQL
ncbi:MAG TPA: VOC family protein [Longimicrobiales bacterium]